MKTKISVPLSNKSIAQLSRVALMEQFVWLMELLRVLAEWSSASMECGEQCVVMNGITMMPELYADNWGTISTQVSSLSLGKREVILLELRSYLCDVAVSEVLPVWQ